MTTFKDRQNASEAKHVRDEELRFKAVARRNKLLGLWTAEKLGLGGAEAADYAKAVVAADFEEPGDDDVIRKVRGDLEAAGVPNAEAEVRRALDQCMSRALDEIRAGV